MNDQLYTFAMNSMERRQAWGLLKNTQSAADAWRNWQQRKGALTPTAHQRRLEAYQLSQTTFQQAFLPITAASASTLVPILKDSEWFSLHRAFFQQECPLEKIELASALRFHLAYYRAFLEQLFSESIWQLAPDVLTHLSAQLEQELFHYAQKALVWDLHQLVTEGKIQAETKTAEFQQYIKQYLGNSQQTEQFFCAYPTLARLLATRVQFACCQLQEFVQAVTESTTELQALFGVKPPLLITELVLGSGDSHEEGRSVIEWRTASTHLVYKPQALVIGERFNQLLTYLETNHPDFSSYQIQRLVKATYTFEAYVPHQSCQNEAEVALFYRRYGQLLAVAYWLGATDLHMENVIACGAYPVFVDVETLISAPLSVKKQVTKQEQIEANSLLVSGLVPRRTGMTQGLQLDALSGHAQKIPQKVQQLTNDQTSQIKFEAQTAYTKEAKNSPKLGEQKVSFEAYGPVILAAFKEMDDWLYHHKTALLTQVETLFADVTVRLIYRNTQTYLTLLGHTLHPQCMTNYLEREKILENLWHHETLPASLIAAEATALAVQDVPLFRAQATATSVWSNGQELPAILPQTPLAHTLERMRQLTPQTRHLSYLLLKESLGLLQYETQKLLVPQNNHTLTNQALRQAADIGDWLVAQLAVDKTKQNVNWLHVSLSTRTQQPQLVYPEVDVYGGDVGLYLFLLTLQTFVPKVSYQQVTQLLAQELFATQDLSKPVTSAFFEDGARIWATFYAARLLPKKALYQQHLMRYLEQAQVAGVPEKVEWIYGSSSLLALLSRICETFSQTKLQAQAQQLLATLIEQFPCQPLPTAGFAHGYAGVLYGLLQAEKIVPSVQLEQKIAWYRVQFEQMLRAVPLQSTSWCRGTQGIQKVASFVKLAVPPMNASVEGIAESCLCHGIAGSWEDQPSPNIVELTDELFLKGDPDCVPLGAFTGLAGIGYQLLRHFSEEKVFSLLYI